MDERVGRVAALANCAAYDAVATRKYVDGAPHAKHSSLRALYGKLVVQVYDYAARRSPVPTVLDFGAGEGTATLPFLELGARVTVVDISRSQLVALQAKCGRYGDRLEVRCEDISETLRRKRRAFDVIVANSFLHHVPDYLAMIREATSLLTAQGQLFSFQDPLRYDSVGTFGRAFSGLAYLSWRVFKGDVLGGLRRRLRRARGIYLEDSVHDNAEFHVVRGGVDQNAILGLLNDLGFDCGTVRYFSTQSRLFQAMGEALAVQNTFSVIARKRG
jgi:SAM-dependent methyltransferase